MLTVKQTVLERYYSSDLENTLLWLKELTTSFKNNIKTKKLYKFLSIYAYIFKHMGSVIILFFYKLKIFNIEGDC